MQTDDFFEEEADLARDQIGSAKPAKTDAPVKAQSRPVAAPSSPALSTAKPPSFLNVVLIAVAALVLGIGIGYFIAMTVVDRTSSGDASTAATSSVVAEGQSQDIPDVGEMPSDHPDISSMMNPDGSINEEAVAQYKAERAAERAAQEAAETSGEADAGDAAEGEADAA